MKDMDNWLFLTEPEILKEIDGQTYEPFEHLVVDVPDEFSGTVIEKLGKKKAEMKSMTPTNDGYTRLEFEVPARGLIGFRSQFLTDTKGEGVMNHSYLEYRPKSSNMSSRKNGALVSMENGEAVAFSIFNLQDRGIMFIKPQDKVYNGVIIGEHAKTNDLDVNPIKAKQQSNVRSSGADEAIKLVPPRNHTLESALEWIDEDELVEVTPNFIRVRKKHLDPTMRKKAAREKKSSQQ